MNPGYRRAPASRTWCAFCHSTGTYLPKLEGGALPSAADSWWRAEKRPATNNSQNSGNNKDQRQLQQLPSLQQSWKLTGELWKTIFLLGNPFVHFHDCWKEGKQKQKTTLRANSAPPLSHLAQPVQQHGEAWDQHAHAREVRLGIALLLPCCPACAKLGGPLQVSLSTHLKGAPSKGPWLY